MSRVIVAIIAIVSIGFTAWLMSLNKGKKFKIKRFKKEEN